MLNHIKHSVFSSDYENSKNLTFTKFIQDIVRIKNKVIKKMKKREKVINENENVYDLNVKDKIYMKTINIDLKKNRRNSRNVKL